jgi:hypothetical protein
MKTSNPLVWPLLLAAGMIGLSAALAWLAPVTISIEWSRRITGVMLGVAVLYYANVIPKTLTALARRRAAGASQAARRFAGWTMVLGSIGYMLAWLLAPISVANGLAGSLLALALLLAMGRCVVGRAAATGK